MPHNSHFLQRSVIVGGYSGSKYQLEKRPDTFEINWDFLQFGSELTEDLGLPACILVTRNVYQNSRASHIGSD